MMASIASDGLMVEPFDIDLESLWAEFDDIPSPPPGIGSDTGNLYISLAYHGQGVRVPAQATSARVEYFFDAGTAVGRYSFWTGPDPLSPHTCPDDLFLYTSNFLLLDEVQWLEFRLCKLHTATEEVLALYPFFLPRVESLLGNLRRIREQIEHVLSRAAFVEDTDHRFQLFIRPIIESTYSSEGAEISRPVACHTKPSSILAPHHFVKNIIGNFSM